MTAQIVVSCQGTWGPERMACRGAFPTGTLNATDAYRRAWAAGWSWRLSRGHQCPAHTRILADTEAPHR